ncbi:MAG: hypothetical protein K0R37_1805, partial [Arthrobacter sp.]|nr:hypothetical protein [Arthrobacter sp.]
MAELLNPLMACAENSDADAGAT